MSIENNTESRFFLGKFGPRKTINLVPQKATLTSWLFQYNLTTRGGFVGTQLAATASLFMLLGLLKSVGSAALLISSLAGQKDLEPFGTERSQPSRIQGCILRSPIRCKLDVALRIAGGAVHRRLSVRQCTVHTLQKHGGDHHRCYIFCSFGALHSIFHRHCCGPPSNLQTIPPTNPLYKPL